MRVLDGSMAGLLNGSMGWAVGFMGGCLHVGRNADKCVDLWTLSDVKTRGKGGVKGKK